MSTSGLVPAQLPGGSAVPGDEQALSVLLLCTSCHLLVRRYLRNNGHLAPDTPKVSQRSVLSVVVQLSVVINSLVIVWATIPFWHPNSVHLD